MAGELRPRPAEHTDSDIVGLLHALTVDVGPCGRMVTCNGQRSGGEVATKLRWHARPPSHIPKKKQRMQHACLEALHAPYLVDFSILSFQSIYWKSPKIKIQPTHVVTEEPRKLRRGR